MMQSWACPLPLQKKLINLYSIYLERDNFVIIEDLSYFINVFNKVLFNNYYAHVKLLIAYLKKIATIFNNFNLLNLL